MKLIDSKVEIIEETNPLKKIEMAGRTCYKSEKNITDESAEKFVQNLIKHEHTAMLEHATFLIEITDPEFYEPLLAIDNDNDASRFLHMTKVESSPNHYRVLISGNLRAFYNVPTSFYDVMLYNYNPKLLPETRRYKVEKQLTSSYVQICSRAGKVVSLSDYKNLTKEEKQAHTYITTRFTCDRGVSHELVRHRTCSFAQESTRYCNYTKNQFGSELTFIKPAGWDEMTDAQKKIFNDTHRYIEFQYFNMIRERLLPQQARAILTNDIKTEIIVTANLTEWQHMFNLRLFGTTGAPHPDIKLLFQKAYDQYFKDYIKKPNKDSEDK